MLSAGAAAGVHRPGPEVPKTTERECEQLQKELTSAHRKVGSPVRMYFCMDEKSEQVGGLGGS